MNLKTASFFINNYLIDNACTVAELIGVNLNFYKFEIVIVYIRCLKVTTMHTTHTYMYGIWIMPSCYL